MRFQFRLAQVLRFFRTKEKAKQTELAKVARKIGSLKQEKLNLNQEIKDLLVKQNQITKQQMAWLPIYFQRVEFCLDGTRVIEKEIEVQKKELEKKKAEYLAVRQRTKALEKLQEKKYSEFRMAESRRAQKELDEAYRLMEGQRQ